MPKVASKTPIADNSIKRIKPDPNFTFDSGDAESIRFALYDVQRSNGLMVDAVDCLTSSVEKGLEGINDSINDQFEKLLVLLERLLSKEDA